MAIGRVRAELVGAEPLIRNVAPPGTQSNDRAATAVPLGASRRVAVFGSVDAATRGNADGAFGQRAGGPSSASGSRLPHTLADT